MRDLLKSAGPDKLDALGDLAAGAGVPPTTPFTKQHGKQLQDLLKKFTPEQLRDAAQGTADPATMRKLEPLMELLNKVARKEALREAVEKFQAGDFDQDLRDLQGSGGRNWWKLVGKYQPGESKNRILIVHYKGRDMVGVADVILGDCLPNGKVPVEFKRVELRGKDGKEVKDVKIPNKTEATPLTGCGTTVSGGAAAGSGAQGGSQAEGSAGAAEAEKPETGGGTLGAQGGAAGTGHAGGGVIDEVGPGTSEEGPRPAPGAGEPEISKGGKGSTKRGKAKGGRDFPIGAAFAKGGAGWPVEYEAISGHGFEVHAGPGKRPPNAIVLPDNPKAVIVPVADGSELVLRLNTPTGRVIGRATRYHGLTSEVWEISSGELRDVLSAQLDPWLRQKKLPHQLDRKKYPARLLIRIRGEPLGALDFPVL